MAVHKVFKDNLELFLGSEGKQARLSTAPLQVGRLLRDLAPKLSIYSDFVNNYEVMIKIITTAREQKPVRKILDANLLKPEVKGLDISSFCIMPIQRIPRYKMLIEDMIKHTDATRIEYAILRHAHTVIKDIAQTCNEGKRNAEHIQKASTIMQCVKKCPTLAASIRVRRFVHQGMLRQYVVKSNALQPRYFFLFSDLLLWTNESTFNGNSVTYRDHITLGDNKGLFRGWIDLVKVQRAKDDVKTILSLGFEVGDANQSVLVFASDEKEKQLWTDALTDIFRNRTS
eukprot:c5578_g1_i1.p1 GENE.c5578_g1_i1~~c5578_g1_i1.p1  ORF type:complete len:286 (+),score=50.57 c5578_g1_i1:2-859(+)